MSEHNGLIYTARHMNGQYWKGVVLKHRGHPPVVTCCSGRHSTRLDALDCVETLKHIPPDSPTGEILARAEKGGQWLWNPNNQYGPTGEILARAEKGGA